MKCCLFFLLVELSNLKAFQMNPWGVSISEQLSQWASKPGLVQNLRRVSWSRVHSHRIHAWYIYLHLVDFDGFHVGKYTRPMDPMGCDVWVMTWFGGFNRSSNNAPGGALGTTKQWVNQAFNGCAFHTIWAIKIQTFVGLGFSWGLYYPVMYEATSRRKSKRVSFVAHLSLKI